jgi:predicted O-methyltransferase YrrM
MTDTPGFFVPHRHAAAVRPVRHAPLEALLATALPTMEAVLATAEGFADRLAELAGPAPEPRLDQDWFPRLDAAVLYALVRERRPRRVVEVGSGHSTRFVARAARDAGSSTSIVCVDPEPRARLEGLPVRRVARLAQDADPALFADLAAGDVLLIDSSHVAMPGSDVDVLLNGVLPLLPPGVLVHLHDIFLPDPYPEAWAWRGYSEQVAVGCLLQGGGYEVLFASHFMLTRAAERVRRSPLARLPLVEGAIESSLWLVKRG